MIGPIIIGGYEFEFISKSPRSDILDYDYDDGTRRYPSTLINHLIIRDQVMKNELAHITFSDNFIDIFRDAICSVSDNLGIDNNDPNSKKWDNITVEIPQDPFMCRALVVFTRLEDGTVNVCFINRANAISAIGINVMMSEYDMLAFYDLFEI